MFNRVTKHLPTIRPLTFVRKLDVCLFFPLHRTPCHSLTKQCYCLANSTSPFPHHAPILPMPTTTSSNTGSSPPRNLRKRKTPPPQESPSANTSSQSHHSLPHYDYPSSSADHYVPPVGNFSNNNPAGTTGELHPINMNPNDTGSPPGARPLSTSKRAEQNRKAQRAFRERRDQCAHSILSNLCSLLTCPR
jgi:hypothetical protein